MQWVAIVFLFLAVHLVGTFVGKQQARIESLEMQVKMLNARAGIAGWQP